MSVLPDSRILLSLFLNKITGYASKNGTDKIILKNYKYKICVQKALSVMTFTKLCSV